jgi:hypothetical protein
MFLSCLGFFRYVLKTGERVGPHLVEVGSKAGHPFGVKAIKAPRAGFAVVDEPHVFKHLEVLRDGGTRDGERPRKFVDGQSPAGELLEDGHARGIAESVETRL